jgi:hypothetical protein
MNEYIVSCDVLEMERGESFTVLPGPVSPGQLVLVETHGYLIPGRWDGIDQLELPHLILDLSAAEYRVIGPVILMDDVYNCLN